MEPWYEAMVGCLGKVWRTNRRRLKPHVKDAFAALLLEIRLEYLPEVYLDNASNIGRSRCDIRGVTELLRHVAARPAAPIVDSAATPLPNSSCGDPWHCIGGPDPWSSVGSSLRAIAAVFVPAVHSFKGAEFDDLEDCSKCKDKNKSECDTKVKGPHGVPAVWEPVSVVAPNLLDPVTVPSGDARAALGYNNTAGVDISSMASSAVVLPASSRCSVEGSWPVVKDDADEVSMKIAELEVFSAERIVFVEGCLGPASSPVDKAFIDALDTHFCGVSRNWSVFELRLASRPVEFKVLHCFRLKAECDDKEIREGSIVQIDNLCIFELNGAIGEVCRILENGRFEIELGPVSTTPGERKSIRPGCLRTIGQRMSKDELVLREVLPMSVKAIGPWPLRVLQTNCRP